MTARGNARQRIVRDDADRTTLLETLAHVVDRYECICHAYCVMDNHYHFVLETPRGNLAIAMRQLNGLYAQRFNRRHDRCGHVFQARYGAILVDKDGYLLTVCRYVVRNPVRAGICRNPGDYVWSSYRATAGLAPAPAFLTIDHLLGMLAPTLRRARERYRAFVADGGDEPLDVVGGRFGPDELMRDRFGHDPPVPEIPRVQVEPLRRPLGEILGAGPGSIAAAYRWHGYTLREIAEHLGCHYSTVSRQLRRGERELEPADA